MTKHLDVYLFRDKVGILEQGAQGRLRFIYDTAWCNRSDARSISLSLPLQTKAFDDSAARPFFAGLLPDDTVCSRLAAILGVSETNDYGLLEELGRECAGAISLYPSGEALQEHFAAPHPLTDVKLAELIKALSGRPLLAGLSDDVRLSLAGAQNKMAVSILKGSYALPRGTDYPSTHIIKPAIADLDHTVTNEFFCMRLAQRAFGSPCVPNVDWRNAKGVSFLLIERYDREVKPSGIRRVHQEDFCQAMGISPQHKYQREHGPSLKDCFLLIDTHSNQPARDRLLLADIVIFNYLIGNADAHAKNFSFVYSKRGAQLSPFYDLLSTRAYPNLAKKMAMKIGGTYEAERVSYKQWDEMAEEAQLSPAYLRARLARFAKGLPELSLKLMNELDNAQLHSAIYAKIHEHIMDYSARILRTLQAAQEA